ncbi:MAG: hypothetical protein ACTS78_02255 [Arsenophonus sp. NC-WZS1-MAG3]
MLTGNHKMLVVLLDLFQLLNRWMIFAEIFSNKVLKTLLVAS